MSSIAAPARSSLKTPKFGCGPDAFQGGTAERVRFSATEQSFDFPFGKVVCRVEDDEPEDSDFSGGDSPRGEAKRFSNATVVMEGSNPLAEASALHRLYEVAQSTLECEKLQDAVRLPPRVSRSEWLAAKTVGIYRELSNLVSVLTDVCTEASCCTMRAGKGVIYRWKDEETGAVQDLPAMEYMTRVVGSAFLTLSDREFIPHDDRSSFPPDFEERISALLRRFFRVYAHVYYHHLETFQENQAEAHLNHCFKHYYFFVSEFKLVDDADMAPLRPLIGHLIAGPES